MERQEQQQRNRGPQQRTRGWMSASYAIDGSQLTRLKLLSTGRRRGSRIDTLGWYQEKPSPDRMEVPRRVERETAALWPS